MGNDREADTERNRALILHLLYQPIESKKHDGITGMFDERQTNVFRNCDEFRPRQSLHDRTDYTDAVHTGVPAILHGTT